MLNTSDLVTDYIELGLAVGQHIDGFVDAYYGPAELAEKARAIGPVDPAELAERARRLLADLEVATDYPPHRRQWLSAQVRGLQTTARKLAGEDIAYLDEIEWCYGVRPGLTDEDQFESAHQALDRVMPGTGPLADRYVAWQETQVVPSDKLSSAVNSLAEDLRELTDRAFGLPDGEHVVFEMVRNQPWGGFNYYLGGLSSRVAINTDLPTQPISLGHLVAHEAYPGHHTEHSRKEAGLVRRRHQMEETIFLVGTPQCLLAEGLADLGLEVVMGEHSEERIAGHLRPLGIPYDAELAAQISSARQSLGAVRGNAAIFVHDRGWSADDAVSYVQRWGLISRPRAEKAIEFIMNPTWRAYPFCYIDGYRVCRDYVAGDASRFETLITEQLLPSQLVQS